MANIGPEPRITPKIVCLSDFLVQQATENYDPPSTLGRVGSQKHRVLMLWISTILLSILGPRALAQDFRSSLILSPYSLSFGDVPVGKASDPQTITLLNSGAASIQINKIAVTGDFNQTNNCPVPPAQLAKNQTCGIEVTFKPSSAAPASGTIRVLHGGSTDLLSVSLSGTGTLSVPRINISPSRVNFPSQKIGTPSAPQTVTLSNSGKETLLVSSIDVAGDFTIMPSSTCESLRGPLAPEASCSVMVTFTPLGAGKRDGRITFTDDAEDCPQDVTLSGIGEQ